MEANTQTCKTSIKHLPQILHTIAVGRPIDIVSKGMPNIAQQKTVPQALQKLNAIIRLKSPKICGIMSSSHIFPPLRRPQVGLWHFGPESWSFWDGELLPVGLPWEPGC